MRIIHNQPALHRRGFLAGSGALAAATLAGCAATDGVGSGTSDSSSSSSALGVEGSRTGKELLLYLSAGHDYKPYLDVISKFEKDKNVKVTIQIFQWGDLQQKLVADFLSGETADLVEEPGGFWATRFGRDGNVMPLDSFLKEDSTFLDDFVDAGVKVRQADGHTYAIPLHVTMGGLVFANKEMLDKAGVKMPTTWQEFKDAAKAIKASGVEYGCALNNDSSYGRPWYLQSGVTWNTKGSEVISPASALADALAFQRDLIYTDKLAPVPVASNEYSAPRKAFTSKRAGLILTGPWDISAIRTEDKNFPLAVGLPLIGKEQKTTIAGSGLMIPAKSQNAKLSWELIKLLTATEVQAKITEAVGMACSRKSWADSDIVKNDPVLSVVAKARELATAPDKELWGNENMAKVADAEKVMYEEVILKNADPVTAVETYNKTASRLLGN